MVLRRTRFGLARGVQSVELRVLPTWRWLLLGESLYRNALLGVEDYEESVLWARAS